MMMAPIGLTQISAVAAGSLVAAAWEGLVLAGVVAVCLRMLPGVSAAARSVVWLAVMMVVAGLPFVHFAGSDASASGSQLHADERIGLAMAGVWALMSVVRAAQLLRSAIWLRGIAQRATPVAVEPEVAALLRRPSGRAAELCVSDEVDRPSVVGFFAPRILVPGTLLERLATDELRQIVLHEMEHLRRGDDWTNLLQKLSLVVFPLNPALIWIERQLCLERELACDDRVLQATGARKAYAACLANLAEHSLVRRGVSLALGAWERQSEVVRRVHRILAGRGNEMGRRQIIGVVAILMMGVVAGADGLAHAPALVSFGPAVRAADVAVVSQLPGAKAPLYTPASFVGRPKAEALGYQPHANPEMPVKAQDVVFHQAAPVTVVKSKQRVAASKTNSPRVEAVKRASNTGHPEIGQPAEDDEPMVVMVTWRSTVQANGALIVQGSQFSYAAVPTRNGWLFVQL